MSTTHHLPHPHLQPSPGDVRSITDALLREFHAGADINEVLFDAVSAAQRALDQEGGDKQLDDHSDSWWDALPLSELMARHRARWVN